VEFTAFATLVIQFFPQTDFLATALDFLFNIVDAILLVSDTRGLSQLIFDLAATLLFLTKLSLCRVLLRLFGLDIILDSTDIFRKLL